MATTLPFDDSRPAGVDDYLFGRGPAWFAFAMTLGLMVMDYVDRQVIVSLFPYMKADWGLSDTQLGALVSVVSVTVALGAVPVALFADRASRVKSIVAMATVWSLATLSCMFTRNYSQLLAARALVGLGEAGYGSVGAALIASHFPVRMRGALLAGFFASASVGSVLGVMLGGVIAARWGWQAAFGVVGLPGLVLALVYLKVRDYRTVELTPTLDRATRTGGNVARHIVQALTRSRTMLWVCIGGAAQLIVVSAVWSWLPSYLNRVQGIAPSQAAVQAALIVLCGAVGSVFWGGVVDRAGLRRPRSKLTVLAMLCLLSLLPLSFAFGAHTPTAPAYRYPDDGPQRAILTRQTLVRVDVGNDPPVLDREEELLAVAADRDVEEGLPELGHLLQDRTPRADAPHEQPPAVVLHHLPAAADLLHLALPQVGGRLQLGDPQGGGLAGGDLPAQSEPVRRVVELEVDVGDDGADVLARRRVVHEDVLAGLEPTGELLVTVADAEGAAGPGEGAQCHHDLLHHASRHVRRRASCPTQGQPATGRGVMPGPVLSFLVTTDQD